MHWLHRFTSGFLHIVWGCALLCGAWSAGAQTVYRCGNSYSNTPCKSDSKPQVPAMGSARKPPVQDGPINPDQLSVLHASTQAPPGQTTIYLCKSQSGGLFWSGPHCASHQALLERMESVPASLPWAQQVQLAQTQWEEAQRLTLPEVPRQAHRTEKARTAASRAPSVQREETTTSKQCMQLHAKLEQLDQRARNGLSSSDADQVRTQRQALRHKLRQGHC